MFRVGTPSRGASLRILAHLQAFVQTWGEGVRPGCHWVP